MLQQTINRIRKTILVILLINSFYPHYANSKCYGSFINPITDINWENLFPITIGGINITSGYNDYHDYNQLICKCAGTPPKIGIPVTFWEPSRIVDVTMSAYCLVGLGGIEIGNSNITNNGIESNQTNMMGTKSSFYHTHWYVYPVIGWLDLLTDFMCIHSGEFDLAYMSEFDPAWDDGELSALLNAESLIFANQLAISSCIADCAAASMNKALDSMFWCAGCHGVLYPLNGAISGHIGNIPSSMLIVERLIGKLHRMGLLKGFDKDEFCESSYKMFLQKSNYKIHLTYPGLDKTSSGRALGGTSMVWGQGKSYPISGEDFSYLVWTKQHCCLDAVRSVAGGQVIGSF